MGRKRISISALAKSTHMPRTTLSRKLAGESAISIDELSALADALDIPLSELIADSQADRAEAASA